MRYYEFKVEVYKFLDSGTYDTVNKITLNGVRDFSVRTGKGKVKDTFDLKLINANNKFFRTFKSGDGSTTEFEWYWGNFPDNYPDSLKIYVDNVETDSYSISGDKITFTSAPAIGTNNIRIDYKVIEYEDTIRIYQKKNSSVFTNSDILISGVVNDISGESTDSSRSLTINGVGLIEIFFNTLSFSKSYSDSDNLTSTTPQIINSLINQVNELNINRVVSFTPPTLRSDNTPFPQITYYANYKRALDILEELSSDRYTKDGQYQYEILYDADKDTYDLIWGSKSSNITTTITEGVQPFGIKFDLTDEDVVNAVIYNCGLDPANHGMEFLFTNTQSGSFNGSGGTKWLYMTETSHIGDDILNEEFSRKPTYWETTDENTRLENYPSSYAYVPTFKDRYDYPPYNEKETDLSVVSDTDWVDKVRFEARGRGYGLAKRITDIFGFARKNYKISLPFESQDTYLNGSIILINSESFGDSNLKLRIMEKTIELGKTTLVVEEDETTNN